MELIQKVQCGKSFRRRQARRVPQKYPAIPGQKSIDASISDGLRSKARQRASRLSTLGKFAPRSIELICETLRRVAAARSLKRPIALHSHQFDAMPQPLAQPVLRRAAQIEFLNRVLKSLPELRE